MHAPSVLLCLALAGTITAQIQLPLPPYNRTYTSTTQTRGFYFQTPTAITITGLRVPDEASVGVQCVEVIAMNGPAPAFPGTATGTQVFYANNAPSSQILPCSLSFNAGDWIGVLGACGTTSLSTSYGPAGVFQSSILGTPVDLTRLRIQTNLHTTGGNQPFTGEPTYEPGRIEVYYTVPSGYATFSMFGDGCGGGTGSSFYEHFTATSPFDLSGPGTGWQMLPAPPSYLVLPSTNAIVTPTSSAIAFGDDQTQQIALPWAFPYGGGTITDIYVCSNGWIGLESTTSTAYNESAAELLNGPARIAALWDDLSPNNGGTVHAEQDPSNSSLFHVTFTDVPEYSATGANTFQVSFDLMGAIETKYGPCTLSDCLAGYSAGNLVPDPGPIDLSALIAHPLGNDLPDVTLAAQSGSRPILGTTFVMEIAGIPTNATLGGMVYSFTQHDPGLSLTSLGMPDCYQYVNLDAILAFFPSGPVEQVSFVVPNAPNLVGLHIYAQGAVFDVDNVQPLRVATTNGGELMFDVN